MGETPIKNKWVGSITGAIHTFFTIGLVAGKAALRIYLPWLNWPIISQLFNLIVDRYGAMIDKEFQLGATFLIIDIQTDAEKRAYDEATDALKQAHSIGDTDAIQKAKDEYKKKLAELIHFGKP